MAERGVVRRPSPDGIVRLNHEKTRRHAIFDRSARDGVFWPDDYDFRSAGPRSSRPFRHVHQRSS
jgi:hypothetical protein